MARHHHIHVHLHDSGEFNEAQHKRQGGQFARTAGSGGSTASPVSSAAKYAIKHTHRPAGASRGAGPQSEEEVAEQKASLL